MPKFLDNIEFYTEGYSAESLTTEKETKDVVLSAEWNEETVSLEIPSTKIDYPAEAPSKKIITDISRDIEKEKDEAIYKIGALSESGLIATNELVQKGLNALNSKTQNDLNSLENKTQEGLNSLNSKAQDGLNQIEDKTNDSLTSITNLTNQANDLIETGKTDITNLTNDGLTQIQDKVDGGLAQITELNITNGPGDGSIETKDFSYVSDGDTYYSTSEASGKNAVCFGENSVASGSNSFIAGVNCTATNKRSVAMQNGNHSPGHTTFTIGQLNKNWANSSFMFGNGNIGGTPVYEDDGLTPKAASDPNSQYSIIGGQSNKVRGQNMAVFGQNNIVNVSTDPNESVSIGFRSIVSGYGNNVRNAYDSIITGTNNKVGMLVNFTDEEKTNKIKQQAGLCVVGSGNIVDSGLTAVLGSNNTVKHTDGEGWSFVSGSGNYTAASGVCMIGQGLRSDNGGQTVIGKYNKYAYNNSLFIVGNGTGTASAQRSNAFEVSREGNTSVYGSLNLEKSTDKKSIRKRFMACAARELKNSANGLDGYIVIYPNKNIGDHLMATYDISFCPYSGLTRKEATTLSVNAYVFKEASADAYVAMGSGTVIGNLENIGNDIAPKIYIVYSKDRAGYFIAIGGEGSKWKYHMGLSCDVTVTNNLEKIPDFEIKLVRNLSEMTDYYNEINKDVPGYVPITNLEQFEIVDSKINKLDSLKNPSSSYDLIRYKDIVLDGSLDIKTKNLIIHNQNTNMVLGIKTENNSTRFVGKDSDGNILGYIAYSSEIESHINDKNNPHNVTKEQLGLDLVVNASQTSSPANGSNSYFTAGGAYTLKNDLTTDINKCVKLSGNQTINNVKTFASVPQVSQYRNIASKSDVVIANNLNLKQWVGKDISGLEIYNRLFSGTTFDILLRGANIDYGYYDGTFYGINVGDLYEDKNGTIPLNNTQTVSAPNIYQDITFESNYSRSYESMYYPVTQVLNNIERENISITFYGKISVPQEGYKYVQMVLNAKLETDRTTGKCKLIYTDRVESGEFPYPNDAVGKVKLMLPNDADTSYCYINLPDQEKNAGKDKDLIKTIKNIDNELEAELPSDTEGFEVQIVRKI